MENRKYITEPSVVFANEMIENYPDVWEMVLVEKKVGKFRPDFYVPDKKIVVEIDGYVHHKDEEPFTKDRERGRYFQKMGYMFIQYTAKDILNNAPYHVQEFVVDYMGYSELNTNVDEKCALSPLINKPINNSPIWVTVEIVDIRDRGNFNYVSVVGIDGLPADQDIIVYHEDKLKYVEKENIIKMKVFVEPKKSGNGKKVYIARGTKQVA